VTLLQRCPIGMSFRRILRVEFSRRRRRLRAETSTSHIGFKRIMSNVDFVSTGYASNMLAFKSVGAVVDPGEAIFRQRDSFRKGPSFILKNWHCVTIVSASLLPT
jgi:hypothetical protein